MWPMVRVHLCQRKTIKRPHCKWKVIFMRGYIICTRLVPNVRKHTTKLACESFMFWTVYPVQGILKYMYYIYIVACVYLPIFAIINNEKFTNTVKNSFRE